MSPLEIDRLLRAAFGHLRAGQRAPAEALYRRILDQHPDHDGALDWLGVVALQNNRPDLAVEHLSRAAAIQPNVAAYHGNLGNALTALGRLEEAAACYRHVLELTPNSAEANNSLGNSLQGQGKFNEAMACYRRALELKPDFAEVHNNLGNACKNLGKLEEAIACYRRAMELNPEYAEAHNNLGNVLKDEGKLNGATASYRRALELKPGYAEAHRNLGDALQNQGNTDEAVASHRRALELNPGFAEAHTSLGVALQSQGMLDEAIACHRRALELKPDFAAALNNLGNALSVQKKFDEANACYRRALELKPDFAEAHNNMGSALLSQGEFAQAAACYRRALELKPGFAEAHSDLSSALFGERKLDEMATHVDEAIRLRPNLGAAHVNRSFLRLLQGDFARGWEEYEWRLKSNQSATPRRAIARPRWDGRPLEGRTIFLGSEQGFGDTLQFIRYAPLVAQAGGNVIVECQPPLKRLFQNSLGATTVIDYHEPLPPFDVQCPLPSLPLAFGTTLDTIPRQVPYVHAADTESIAQWKSKLADDASLLKVGLAWAGNTTQKNNLFRSIALKALAPLGRVPGVRFFSLQKGEPAKQTREPPAELPIVDWTDELTDFADTAALIANLDLVISVCTSVAHLAGAMGKPVWTLLSFGADWRWLQGRDDSPWYPTMRLFRQPTAGDWPSVVERVADALRRRAAGEAFPSKVDA